MLNELVNLTEARQILRLGSSKHGNFWKFIIKNGIQYKREQVGKKTRFWFYRKDLEDAKNSGFVIKTEGHNVPKFNRCSSIIIENAKRDRKIRKTFGGIGNRKNALEAGL